MSILPTIDDYDIGQLLGRGGFASVYRSRERKTGALCALKIMEKINIRKHNMENRVVNEIKIQSELHYKGIVEYYCHFEYNDCVYMVLELCEGTNLYRYLKSNGPLNEEEAAVVYIYIYVYVYINIHRYVHMYTYVYI
jgi:serine/threonine protein kinase